ncbi:MAG: GspE/PulE family protein [Candidatus Moranbacteria bacterium]|jgi:type II secretory ATPase GspE/PulE/Tfp pilus assembly ATPase PilB-like protein|nr:GspE/PulE family protein [Candidatus Moranbacteria bacterium]
MVQIIRQQKSDEGDKSTQKLVAELREQSAENIAAKLSEKTGIPYVDLHIFPIDSIDVQNIPEEKARGLKIACFQKNGNLVRILFFDPQSPEAIEYVATLAKENNWRISRYVGSDSSLEKAWGKYKKENLVENIDKYRLSLTGEDLEEFEEKFKDLLELKNNIGTIPTTEALGIIIAGSIKMKASDIHLEPQEDGVRLRYRIDGILQDIGSFSPKIYSSFISRIKMMGKMKLNVKDSAQDGHISIDLTQVKEAANVDIRVSIIPGNFGESIVMRILNQSETLLQVEDLGLRGLAFEKVEKQVTQPNGLILTTGPTGSGKTTTLYALINRINNSGVKIITIEDPIEYRISGISQTQVSKSNYTFSEGLRAIVRQDPDVILVGEIRDKETAEVAIDAALTGHLVISTLHTNNAPASIPRLVEMGARESLIASSLNISIAQRLVRKLCPDCKKKYQPAQETIESLKKIVSAISPKAKINLPEKIDYLYQPVGCPNCHNLGYRGRIGIFEVMETSKEIKQLIHNLASEEEILKSALEDGMTTMQQDGIIKAIEGITSMEEIWRVTGKINILPDEE